MKNTTGRDNKMYYISDGFNLDKTLENQFVSLMQLNNVASSPSSMSTLHLPPPIPSTRSQLIQNKTIFATSTKSRGSRLGLKIPDLLFRATSQQKHSLLAPSSALGLNATDRTSANSRPKIGLSASLKKDLATTRRNSMSPPSTEAGGDKNHRESIGEY